jgi:hypothetical protein
MPPVPSTVGAALDILGVDRDLLADVMPRVDADRVPLRVASPWFRRLWVKGIRGVTTPWGVYVHPEVAKRFAQRQDDNGLALLMVHELMHVEQLRRLGVTRHTTEYIVDYLQGRASGLGHWESYRRVRLEEEARAAARLVRTRLEGAESR